MRACSVACQYLPPGFFPSQCSRKLMSNLRVFVLSEKPEKLLDKLSSCFVLFPAVEEDSPLFCIS